MRLVLAIYYRLKILLFNPLYVALLLGMPVFLLIFTGIVIQGDGQQTQIPIALVDLDNSEYSKLVVKRMCQKPVITVDLCTVEEAERKVSIGQYEAAYIIGKGFMNNILHGETDEVIEILKSPSSISAEFLGELLSGEVIRLSSNVTAANYVVEEYVKMGKVKSSREEGDLWIKAWEFTDSQWEPSPLMTMEYKEIARDGIVSVQDTGKNNVVSLLLGVMISYLMFNMLISGSWIVTEREGGRIKRIISSPMALSMYLIGNLLAMAIVNMMMVIIALYGIKRWFGMFEVGMAGILLMTVLYLLCAGSISLLLSMLNGSVLRLQMIVPALTLATSLFGGCFVDLSQISERFKYIAMLMPQHWFMKAIQYDAVMKMMPYMAVLLMGTTIFLITGTVLLKTGRFSAK